MGSCQSIPLTNNLAEKIIEYLEKNDENFVVVDFLGPDQDFSLPKVNFFKVKNEPYFQAIIDGVKGLKQSKETFKSYLATGILKSPTLKEIDIALGLVKEDDSFDQKIMALLKIAKKKTITKC
jgi:hypothetical protein